MHAVEEQFRLFWSQGTAGRAKSFLLTWCFDTLSSGIKQLCAPGSTMLASMQGLPGYYPRKITNGPLEGLNNKIKTMKRQAYGFRDTEYFKLRLYNLHNSFQPYVRVCRMALFYAYHPAAQSGTPPLWIAFAPDSGPTHTNSVAKPQLYRRRIIRYADSANPAPRATGDDTGIAELHSYTQTPCPAERQLVAR